MRHRPRPVGLCVADTEKARLILDTETLSTRTHLCAHTYSFTFLSLSLWDTRASHLLNIAPSQTQKGSETPSVWHFHEGGRGHATSLLPTGRGPGHSDHGGLGALSSPTSSPATTPPTASIARARGVQPGPRVPVPGPVSTRTESGGSGRWAAGVGDPTTTFLIQREVAGAEDGKSGEPGCGRSRPGRAGRALLRHPGTWRGQGQGRSPKEGSPVPGPGSVGAAGRSPLRTPTLRLPEEVRGAFPAGWDWRRVPISGSCQMTRLDRSPQPR